jgi:hypothetical protein
MVFTSVPSYRIDNSPSEPAHTYTRSASGPTCGASRPSWVSPPADHAMREIVPPAAGIQMYSSSDDPSWVPKSSRVRILCIFEPRTPMRREPSRE